MQGRLHDNMHPVEGCFMNNVINLIGQHKDLARHLNHLTQGFHELKETVDKILGDNAITGAHVNNFNVISNRYLGNLMKIRDQTHMAVRENNNTNTEQE